MSIRKIPTGRRRINARTGQVDLTDHSMRIHGDGCAGRVAVRFPCRVTTALRTGSDAAGERSVWPERQLSCWIRTRHPQLTPGPKGPSVSWCTNRSSGRRMPTSGSDHGLQIRQGGLAFSLLFDRSRPALRSDRLPYERRRSIRGPRSRLPVTCRWSINCSSGRSLDGSRFVLIVQCEELVD